MGNPGNDSLGVPHLSWYLTVVSLAPVIYVRGRPFPTTFLLKYSNFYMILVYIIVNYINNYVIIYIYLIIYIFTWSDTWIESLF